MGRPFELLVLSGKGGTGKTSVSAALAVLAKPCVVADCDVDAADLHLVLKPEESASERFVAGKYAALDATRCSSCENALSSAASAPSAQAATRNSPSTRAVAKCCGVCVRFCPRKAIDFKERDCGELMSSKTRVGPMAHAKLKAGGENSGKLVSAVKEKAVAMAEREGLGLMIVDGPPGIGCPVIAATAGASLALLVAEPTLSAEHDLLRAIKLLKQFGVPAVLCVNKWDVNPELAEAIEKAAGEAGVPSVGRIRFDAAISKAQTLEKALVETSAPSASDFEALWRT
jgi:MinD superfamily P-loop ATPase